MSYDETRAVIADWHGKGRNHVAITPRFAITSTAGADGGSQSRFVGEFPDLHVQTHLSENRDEIAYTSQLLSGGDRLYRRLRPLWSCWDRKACSVIASTSPNARRMR